MGEHIQHYFNIYLQLGVCLDYQMGPLGTGSGALTLLTHIVSVYSD